MAVAASDTVVKLRSLIYGGKRSSVTRMVSFCHNTGCWSNVGELETWARTIHMSSSGRISFALARVGCGQSYVIPWAMVL